MSAPPRERPRPDFDWDAEQEVDLSRFWNALVLRWWLPLLGLVLGAILGYLISLGGGEVYKAQATLYLGQPYSNSGNVQLQSLQTNPSTVKQIVNADVTVAAASAASGLRPAQIRNRVAVAAVAGNLSRLGQAPLVTVTLTGHQRDRVRAATNSLAASVVKRVGGPAKQKIALLEQQIAFDRTKLRQLRAQLDAEQGAAQKATTPSDKLLAITTTSTLLQQLTQTQNDLFANTQARDQVTAIETAHIVTPAGSSRVTARSRRNTVVVSAIVGLLLGILAAFLWDGVAARVGRRAS
jgi:uncharacterized protein involved in exopolysaccharide biosynthesis